MDPRRRALLCLAGAATLPPRILRAASSGPKRIVWLVNSVESRQRIRHAFRSRGILEGRDIMLTFQGLPANVEKECDELAESLVRSPPDIIVLPGHLTLWALKRRTRDIPVVFYNLGPDPAKVGIVESNSRPGGNFTGSTQSGDTSLETRRWAKFKQLHPSMRRAAQMVDQQFWEAIERDSLWHGVWDSIRRDTEVRLGIEIVRLKVPKKATREEIARMVTASGAQSVVLEAYVTPEAGEFLYTAPMPSMCWFFESARKGCHVATTFDFLEGETYAVHAVERILRGESPAVIPVYQHVRLAFALNRRRARELGVDIPASLLVEAEEIYD